MRLNKQAFLDEYRARLVALYPWAQDEAKLTRFMASVRNTLETTATTWNKDGECVRQAWRAIGGKGAPTYKALRALPDSV